MELQWPLILFTTLLSWSAGLFAVQAAMALANKNTNAGKAQMPALTTSFALMVIGGIAVFFHLEHWERIFNGFGHLTSGITQELIAIVFLVAVMVAYFVCLRRGESGLAFKVVAALAIALSLVLVAVMGHSYVMAARPAWNTFLQIGSLLGAACVLGSSTFAVIEELMEGGSSALAGLAAVVGSVANALLAALYAVAMNSTGGFAFIEYYYDPTRPTAGMIDPTQYSALFGDNAALAVSAIAFSLVACVFAFLGKRKGCWKCWGVAVAICGLAATILLRVVFYSCGGSVLYMM